MTTKSLSPIVHTEITEIIIIVLNWFNKHILQVSPKRKVEPLQHLYVANNVKTSTFSEQIEKSNLSNTKNLNNNTDYAGSHSSINMVSTSCHLRVKNQAKNFD